MMKQKLILLIILLAYPPLNGMYEDQTYRKAAIQVFAQHNLATRDIITAPQNFSYAYDGNFIVYNKQTKHIQKLQVPAENSALDHAIIVRFLEITLGL